MPTASMRPNAERLSQTAKPPGVGRRIFCRRAHSAWIVGSVMVLLLPASTQAAKETEPAAGDAAAHFEFARAKLLADKGDYEGALGAFERAIELDGADPYSFVEAAKLYGYLAQISRTRQQQRTYLESSLDLVRQARELSPDNTDVLRLFAETHMRLGEEQPSSYAVAQGAFEHLRAVSPGDLGALTSLAQLYLWSQQPGKAADVLLEAARYSPRNRMIQGMLADSLLAAGRQEEAEKAIADLLPLDPTNLEFRLRLAEMRAERGDHRGAVEALEGAPDDDGLNGTRIRNMLAREYHLAGRQSESLLLVDEIIADPMQQASPSNGMQRLRVAVLAAMVRYEEAIQTFEPLLSQTGDAQRRAEDSLLLSRLYERTGAFDIAAEVLRRQLAGATGEIADRLRLALAGVLERSGDLEGSLKLLRQAFEAASDSQQLAMTIQGLSGVLDSAGREDEAIEVLEIAASRASQDPGLVFALKLQRASLQAQIKDWPALLVSAKALRQEVRSESQIPGRDADPAASRAAPSAGLETAALQLEAEALAGLGRMNEALAVLDTAPEPEAPQLVMKRVQLLFDHGSAADADALLQDLVTSGSAADWFFVARLYQRYENHKRAIPLLEKVVAETPDGVSALFALGASYEREGQMKRASDTFEQLLEVAPDHAPTLNYLGYMWVEKGLHLDRAAAMILRAVAVDPDNGAYVDSLGWALYQLERYAEARPHLEWATRLSPGDATVFVHLGDVYAALGETSKAREAYAKALTLDVDDEAAAQAKIDQLDADADADAGS